MTLARVSLEDKYDLDKTRIYVSGSQAVVRLVLMQHARDRAQGHDTAGFVTGYRGSPVGGIDQQFWRAGKTLEAASIIFQPGINEDLAATALWGTQQAGLAGEGKYDGVFGLWYGKGPGVDRTGDVFRHANHAGTSALGGVVALMGDDHTCESSTSAHQSEFALVDAMIPILNPAGAQEILDYGLYGFALSRFSGCWVGLKCIKDNIESTAIIDASPGRVKINTPDDFQMPPGGLNIRLNDTALEKEARLHDFKRYAIQAFTHANHLDKLVYGGGKAPKIGIVTTGKSYLDTAQALGDLGIGAARADELGLKLYKVALVWPLEPSGIRDFAKDLDLIIVVEEKRSLIETQIREQLYGAPCAPLIIGKHDEEGRDLFPAKGALEPNKIALAISTRLLERAPDEALKAKSEAIAQITGRIGNTPEIAARTPWFCSGCPHNTSTRVPEGARASAGIGCHYMALWMDRQTCGFTQMGGEGANWVGEAPFSTRDHIFQNIGDGTYQHSGLLAIRAASAAGVNITYKILFNDAVAMTGGQPVDGALSVAKIAHQVAAEGARRIYILSDHPEKYPLQSDFPPGTIIKHRDYLNPVQEELARVKGLSILIFDQTCAAELRRRRKRGLAKTPKQRVFINSLVCEGCGDCSVQSNCVSIIPLETEYGRKRAIHQSSCNKDFSCLDGFCPSFVTITGARLKAGTTARLNEPADGFEDIPMPRVPPLDKNFAMVITGVGGTGVVTIGALIGMAAHLEGKGCGIIDMAGLAQKGGAVISNLRLAPSPDDIQAIRVAAGGADPVLGCDYVVTASEKVLACIKPGRTKLAVNNHETITADFTLDPDAVLPTDLIRTVITARAGANSADFIDAGTLATRLMGDSIAANLFLLGFAWQKAMLPLSHDALIRAIKINGVAVEMNTKAFLWGRRAAWDIARVETIANTQGTASSDLHLSSSLDEAIARRMDELTAYQNAALAARYEKLVERTREAEAKIEARSKELSRAVMFNYHKLLGYKDEYEVARLFSNGEFEATLRNHFSGDIQIEFQFAPPFIAQRDKATRRLRKLRFGPWMMRALRLLAGLKIIRGSLLDPFRYQPERALERALIRQYETDISTVLDRLNRNNYQIAVDIASLPAGIRGFGPIKIEAAKQAEAKRDDLFTRFYAESATS